MKKYAFLFLSIFSVQIVWAECASSGFRVFPESNQISPNQLFMLEGYAFDEEVILELNRSHPIYLKSEIDSVQLSVEELCEGQFSVTQAILKPFRKLTPNQKYHLVIHKLEKGKSIVIKGYNPKKRKTEPFSWTVKDQSLKEKVDWSKKPSLKTTKVIEYGCGPSVNAIFEFSVNQNRKVLIKTELIDLETNTSTFYYLLPWENEIYVGHGMCSGAFIFKSKKQYAVRFSLMDLERNVSGKMTEWTTFTDPYSQYWEKLMKK